MVNMTKRALWFDNGLSFASKLTAYTSYGQVSKPQCIIMKPMFCFSAYDMLPTALYVYTNNDPDLPRL
jgi:hypothetical protein